MEISYFRSRIEGPEIILEDVVADYIEKMATETKFPYWVASSPRIGSGMPDLLFVTYTPEVYALSTLKYSDLKLLAFLRAVNGADLDTIMLRLNYSERLVHAHLTEFIRIDAIEDNKGLFSLTKPWLNILPTIISIEVKVHNWQIAVNQANRNRIFSHLSYIALPERLAFRIANNKPFVETGLGLLSINENSVDKIREPRSSQPQIWEYYYKLAFLIANYIDGGGQNAVPNPNRRSAEAFS